MKTITLGKLAKITNGLLIRGNPGSLVQHINYGQYRSLRSHHVYIYNKSSNWTKQLRAIQAVKPVAAILPSHFTISAIPGKVGIIKTKDPRDAFWKIALWNWHQYKNNLKVIGITGSAGKSTTTAMVASIMKYVYPMVTTQGNLNTYYYLPGYLTLLNGKHRLLLLEMGMKSLNDIRRQCLVVKPHVGAVTNVGEAHAGSLGNPNLVIKAKSEMVEGVRPGGILYTNIDDPRSRKMNFAKCRGKVRTFGIANRADVKGTNIKFSNWGMTFSVLTEGKRYNFFIPIFGVHNVYNALAAIGIARSFGVPFPTIQKGLATFKAPKMRLQFLQSRSGRILINDAWNASPSSMQAGLSVLKHIYPKRPKIAVLGDMLELGSLSYSSHYNIGKFAAKLGLNQLVTVGKNGKIISKGAIAGGMSPSKVFSFSSLEATARHLSARTPANAVLYFKASRKLHFENLVKRLH